jgi:adenylate cyclase
LAVWALASLGLLERLELKGLDFLFLVRGPRPAESPIVLVAIDHQSLQELGRDVSSWPRDHYAQLIERLRGARVVALDILFEQPRDPAQDRRLAAAAKAAGNVVWAATFARTREARFLLKSLSRPLPLLLEASPRFGYIDIFLDPDNTVRRSTPVDVHHGEVFRSFTLKIVEEYSGTSPLEKSPDGMHLFLRRRKVPLDADNAFLINYLGPPGTFRRVPFIRALRGEVPAETFRDKIVLVGLATTTLGTQDHFYTSFYWQGPGTNELMPGVEIHANIIDTYLSARPLERAGPTLRGLSLLAIGLAIGLLMASLHPVWGALGSVALGLAGTVIPIALFNAIGIWLDLAAPLLLVPIAVGATAAYRFTGEERLKGVAARTLGRYVSREVAQEILERGDDISLGGTRRRITVLFTDIRGFTGLSERLKPEEVVDLLNSFFARLSAPILRHQGTLDKYIGDAIMAFWGAPLSHEDDAARAVRAGLEMLQEAEALSRTLEGRLGVRLEIGIGVSTGDAVVGHIGSPERMGYTAIGDTVNIASRLQDLTKEHHFPLLISHTTYDEAKFFFQTERVGFVPVKGRSEPIGVYRVLGEKPAPLAGVETRA